MFFEVGRIGEGGHRETLAAGGRHQQDFGVAGFAVGHKHGALAESGDRPAEDQVAGCEINLDVFFREVEIGDPVAFLRIERGLVDLTGQVGRDPCFGHAQAGQQERGTAIVPHTQFSREVAYALVRAAFTLV